MEDDIDDAEFYDVDEDFEDDEDADDVDFEGDEDDELAPDANAPHGYYRDDDGDLFPIYKLSAEVVAVNGMFAILTHALPDGSPQFDELTETTAVIESYLHVDVSSNAKFNRVWDKMEEAEEAGRIKLSKRSWDMLSDLDQNYFDKSKDLDRWVWNFKRAEERDERQFYLESKRRKRGKSIDIFPVIWRDAESDGKGGYTARVRAFLMAHESNQPQAKDLMRIGGTPKWKRDSTGFHVSFFQKKEEAVEDLKDLDAQDNIEITNLAEVLDSIEHVGALRRKQRQRRPRRTR